jgi:anti-anti-sigma factor
MEQLGVDVQHVDGGVRVVLVGELDLGAVSTFETCVRPLMARYDLDQLTVDCAQLTFLDAAGLTSLLQLARGMSGEGRLTLCDAGRAVTLVLDGTATRDEFRLVDRNGLELSAE